MLEKDIENLIALHPDEIFPGEGFTLIGQQVAVNGQRIDVLFEDKHKRKIIVEVKRGVLQREDSGQITEYYGLLRTLDEETNYEMILCANTIPPERRDYLDRIGIGCKEISASRIRELATKYDYHFIDDQSTRETTVAPKEKPVEQSTSEDPISIWIFQGNPQKYDILNALDDPKIGNQIHWTVSQNKEKIHKGHLVLLWMSGEDSGIYALARIETEPEMMEEYPEEMKYWLDQPKHVTRLSVKLLLLRKFINKPILREELKRLPGLANLSILRQSQGTNFPVRDEEWIIINQLM